MGLLGVGVIGAGFMGSMHAQVYATLPGVRLVGVADPGLGRAERAAAHAPGAIACPDYRSLLADTSVDFVSVCTLDTLHRQPVEDAAAAGKHVFLEKPIASTMEDGRAIVEACRRAKVKLGVGFLLRNDPRFGRVKDLMDAGLLGDPIHVSTRRNSPRDEGPARYGGALPLPLHVTIHDVDLVLWLLSGKQPATIYARWVDKLLGRVGTQDSVFAILQFTDGTLANFESSWALPEGSCSRIDAKLELVGTKGMVEVDCSTSGVYFADHVAATYPDTQHWPTTRGRIGGDLREELSRFVDDLREGRTYAVTGEEALEALRVVLAMIESAEMGVEVAL